METATPWPKTFSRKWGSNGMRTVITKSAGALPHGYLKRLELAKCLALRADLIILDELFSGLSMAEVASILPVIDKLRLEGKTFIMIEHRLRELFRIADRVMVLNFGRKIAEGRQYGHGIRGGETSLPGDRGGRLIGISLQQPAS